MSLEKTHNQLDSLKVIDGKNREIHEWVPHIYVNEILDSSHPFPFKAGVNIENAF